MAMTTDKTSIVSYLLVCVVNRRQIVRFQEILARYPSTFAYVSEVNETMGNFKRVIIK